MSDDELDNRLTGVSKTCKLVNTVIDVICISILVVLVLVVIAGMMV